VTLESQVNIRLAKEWEETTWKHWRDVFAQGRTAKRAIDVLSGLLFSDSRQKTITASIRIRGEDQRHSWAADYAVFSSAVWKEEDMFHGVFEALIPLLPSDGPIVFAIDDTCLPKTGIHPGKSTSKSRKVEEGLGRWCHDSQLPPWVNPALQWGLLMFHGGFVIPTRENGRSTLITTAFEVVPDLPKEFKKKKKKKKKFAPGSSEAPVGDDNQSAPKKRRGRPSKAELAARAEQGLIAPERPPKSTDIAVKVIRRVRQWLDDAGLRDRILCVVGDGSYTNATVIHGLPERTTYTGRIRPDCALCLPGTERPDGTCRYGKTVANLRDIMRDSTQESAPVEMWAGGDTRKLKIKTIPKVYRPTSTRKTPLRAMMLIPQLYGPKGNRSYTHEAYLLTTDLTTPPEVLTQAYLDRWSIEVCHRDTKCVLGVGEAQVSNPRSNHRVHAALAASWAMLQIVALRICGCIRTDDIFGKAPRWRVTNRAWRTRKRLAEGKSAPGIRPSAVDILGLFRRSFRVDWSKRQVPFRL
jgi:hypothetical protein